MVSGEMLDGVTSNSNKLLSIYEILAAGFVKFSVYNFLCNLDFLKSPFCVSTVAVTLSQILDQFFENLTFDFGLKFAKFLKKSMFFKSLISKYPVIGKLQNWAKQNFPPFSFTFSSLLLYYYFTQNYFQFLPLHDFIHFQC